MLRPYQRRAINQLYAWFSSNPEGNPCLVLPTGSGKSHIIASLCQEAVCNYPSTRILMLTHVKELIEQDAQKLLQHWPLAPLGIYSAGLRSKELDTITFAGIQSIRNHATTVGHIDLVLVDEAHLISHKDEGGYRTLLRDLLTINPSLRVIGLTATPYRLGHGLITDKPALFSALIEPVTIEELIRDGYLSTLRSKATKTKLITDGVHKRGGEYIESELQAAVNCLTTNEAIAEEVEALGADKLHWLVFCSGVEHSYAVADAMRRRGILCETITGDTPAMERAHLLSEFKAGKIRAITNANVLTTGFDYPDIDLIVMLRPTMSPGLYMQMAGRGLRLKSHTDHCLVLDFAGNVSMHGPIVSVRPPSKAGEAGAGVPLSKICPNCDEIILLQAKVCPSCGYVFPVKEKEKSWQLHQEDIMGINSLTLKVTSWQWDLHIGASGREMLRVSYYGALSDPCLREYLTIYHLGYAGERALSQLRLLAAQAGVPLNADSVLDLCRSMTSGRPPSEITYKRDGKFFRVLDHIWSEEAPKLIDEKEILF